MAPNGTVTFLFTDIEGSTRLWERCPDDMRVALKRHDQILRDSIERNRGMVFKTVGDAFCAAFSTAPDALYAALDSQSGLTSAEWQATGPIRVRMGLHTGEAEARDNDYFGQTVNRVARLQSIAYGGQTLLSQATYELVRDHLPDSVTLHPMGLHRLKDLNRAEQVFQVTRPDLTADFPPLKSLDSLPNNLPIQLTSFIGREREMEDVKRLVASHRLVTLLGPGGTGKTRLSLQICAELLDQFSEGVWFVELARLTDPSQVARTAASVMNIQEEPGTPLEQTLIETLKARSTLLILDNCEHLVHTCAEFAQKLLASCKNIQILTSSREPLNVSGEATYRVPSLALPDPRSKHTPDSLTQFESVRLFIDRAVSIKDTFVVTNQNAAALAGLCARLDGIPLAIELAAARVRSLSVEEINSKLDNCFRLLTGGSRTALPRQQTLRALIDWSYDMLSDSEKALLRRLSVFSGGWTLEEVESVCTDDSIEDWEILDLLTSLVDKSLAIAEQTKEQTRYKLLETIRQYCRDRLLESGESTEILEKHFFFFLDFAKTTSAKLSGAEEQTALELLEREGDNLRSALDWGIENRPLEALECAVALGRYWYLQGFLREGREMLEKAQLRASVVDATHLIAEADFHLGKLALEQGEYASARASFEKNYAFILHSGDIKKTASTLNGLATIDYQQERYAEARVLYEECLELNRTVGNKAGIAGALRNLGTVVRYLNDYELGRSLYEESLILSRELGDRRGVASLLLNMGNSYYDQEDYVTARRYLEQSLFAARELADNWYIAYSISALANLALNEGDLKQARLLAQEGLDLVRDVGDKAVIVTLITTLGDVALKENEFALAHSLFSEAIAMRLQLGQLGSVAELLQTFANLAVSVMKAGLSTAEIATKLAMRALRLLGAATAERSLQGTAVRRDAQDENQEILDAARSVLEEEAFTVAITEGKSMTIDQAVAYSRQEEGYTVGG